MSNLLDGGIGLQSHVLLNSGGTSGESEEQITKMVAELFGTNPAPKAVAAFAADLAEFDRQLGDYVKVHRNTDRGLIDTNGSTSNIPNLAHYAKTKEKNELACLLGCHRVDRNVR